VFLLLAGFVGGQEITVERSVGTLSLALRTGVESYQMLTRRQPIEFRVTGPTMVRIYTRLVWHSGLAAQETYELVTERADWSRRDTLRSERSASARSATGQLFGKWRSVYLRVPRGTHRYRLRLGKSGSDTVAARFESQALPRGTEVPAVGKSEAIEAIDDSTSSLWYPAAEDSDLVFAVSGPARLDVSARLLFPRGTSGRRRFTLRAWAVESAGIEKSFEVLRSKSARLADPSGGSPSVVRRIRLNVPGGEHQVRVRMLGRSGLVRIQSFPGK
jgi:hypothetical protein